MDSFYSDMIITLIASGIGMYIMMKLQAKREREAEERYQAFMKSMGLETEIKDDSKD